MTSTWFSDWKKSNFRSLYQLNMLSNLVGFLYIHHRFRSNATREKVTYKNWASNQPENIGASIGVSMADCCDLLAEAGRHTSMLAR